MPRLVINPGTPQVGEIHLKPGSNIFGRAPGSDFKIDDPSVSGTHCQIMVSDGATTITDLGSTNGTFVDQSPVRETVLQPGQTVRLGEFEMLFDADAPARPVSVRMRPTGLATANLAVAEAEPAAETAPPVETITPGGPMYCKSHIKSPAEWMCRKCNKYFCSLCVGTRRTGNVLHHLCRACGSECVPLEVHRQRQSGRGFFARLPGAVVYPFRGFGLLILICATLVFAALDFISAGIFTILLTIVAYGFLFLFMQNIIHSTASDENEPLSLPGADDLFAACFRLLGTILVSFGLAIGLIVWAAMDGPPMAGMAIIPAVILGCLYFPMAFLAVAMKDSVMAANPMVVIPAILKMPLQYLVTAVLLMVVFGVRQLGNMMAGAAEGVSFSTRDMSVLFMALGFRAIWSFVSVYLLTVSMRILGLLYITKKHKLGWFNY